MELFYIEFLIENEFSKWFLHRYSQCFLKTFGIQHPDPENSLRFSTLSFEETFTNSAPEPTLKPSVLISGHNVLHGGLPHSGLQEWAQGRRRGFHIFLKFKVLFAIFRQKLSIFYVSGHFCHFFKEFLKFNEYLGRIFLKFMTL